MPDSSGLPSKNDHGQRCRVLRTLPVMFPIPDEFRRGRVFLVGAKGTGMTALAEILAQGGAQLSGSDVAEEFYTDRILAEIGVELVTGFAADALPPDAVLVIHSAAYDPKTNPQLIAAAGRGLPVLSYPEALGRISQAVPSAAIAGVHGKTTTTALYGELVRATGTPASVLSGSAVSGFAGRSTLLRGNAGFVAETCEYRRHFLHFHPRAAVITSVEADHLDYFRDREDVLAAFREFVARIGDGGLLVYCADDAGAGELADWARSARPDLRLLPYGVAAEGPFRLTDVREEPGRVRFSLHGAGLDEMELRVPGIHNAANTAAAIALLAGFAPGGAGPGAPQDWSAATRAAIRSAISGFRGTKRRAELVGEVNGIRIMDDYGHHPTAIRSTLAGLRSFYRPTRLIVSFMSHTFSRTRALLPDFARAFADADRVYIHRIYPSAREAPDPETTGNVLAEAISAWHPDVRFVEEPEDMIDQLLPDLGSGDLVLTLGAGNNWIAGRSLLHRLQSRSVLGSGVRT